MPEPQDNQTLSERFRDRRRIERALRRAAELARLRKEMWETFDRLDREAGAAPRGPDDAARQ